MGIRYSVRSWFGGLDPRGLVALAVFALAGCSPGDSDNSGSSSTPTPDSVEILREIQLTEAALLPEQDPHLVDVQVMEDRVIFTYDGSPSLLPAPDNVIAGALGEGYLRRVVSVREMAARMFEIMTMPAELGELILDGHFIAHLHQDNATARGDVITNIGEDGLGGAQQNLDGRWQVFTPQLGAGISCRYTEGFNGIEVTPRFDIDLDVDVEIDIRVAWNFIIPRGELHTARFILYGAVDPGITIEANENGMVSCTWSLADFLKARGSRIPKIEVATTIPVGPVPVVITHSIEPVFQVEVTGRMETGRTTLTADGHVSMRAGVEYDRNTDTWNEILEPETSGSVNLSASERGTLRVQANTSAGVKYSAKIYDALGPGIQVAPRLEANFIVDPMMCTWNASLEGAIRVQGTVDLTVPVIDYKLAGLQIHHDFARRTFAEAMGMVPWCDVDAGPDADAGMVSLDSGTTTGTGTSPTGTATNPTIGGGDASVPPGGDASVGTGVDAGDVCAAATDCESCNALAPCGFCPGVGCMHDSQRASCSAGWQDSRSACVDDCPMYDSCGACMFSGYCGWCPGQGCVTDPGANEPEPCGGFIPASGTEMSCQGI